MSSLFFSEKMKTTSAQRMAKLQRQKREDPEYDCEDEKENEKKRIRKIRIKKIRIKKKKQLEGNQKEMEKLKEKEILRNINCFPTKCAV